MHCPTPYITRCRTVLPVRPTRYITRCPLSVKLQGNKLWYNAPSGVSGSRRHSAEVASLSFDPKIVSALEKDRTSKLYTRWRPSNKRLHTDQFSSATLPLKFYLSFSTTSTVGKKRLWKRFWQSFWGGRDWQLSAASPCAWLGSRR